jgi:hypothetical protein
MLSCFGNESSKFPKQKAYPGFGKSLRSFPKQPKFADHQADYGGKVYSGWDFKTGISLNLKPGFFSDQNDCQAAFKFHAVIDHGQIITHAWLDLAIHTAPGFRAGRLVLVALDI